MTRSHDDTPMDRDDPTEIHLQARLRALRGDVAPGRDLWPGIAAAIAAQPVDAQAETGTPDTRSPAATPPATLPRSTGTRHHGRRPRRRAWVGWSAAASLALAVALGWSLRPGATGDAGQAPALADAPAATSPSTSPAVATPATPSTATAGAGTLPPAFADTSTLPILLRQADAMSREYAGAVREIEASRGSVPANAALAGAAAELDRSATEIRQALARSPDSRFLVDRLQRVYAQRLALARHAATA